jgi:hypothetical protein
MIQVSAKQKQKPMDWLCSKPPLQGVWGAARHPSGEREGRSPLACAKRTAVSTAERREAQPARIYEDQ